MKDYFIGLDIGTDSVGWAVTNEDYTLCRFKSNSTWGVHAFDESQTAQERRSFRSAVRRGNRKKQRIAWLQMLFNEEISKKDCAFFQRLKESNLYLEDKTVDTPYAVFADKDYTDQDYHKDYPTIYHLRKELVKCSEPHDVRLVYLAIAHIIKNRGHFLFESLETDYRSAAAFEELAVEAFEFMNEEYGTEIICSNLKQMSEILKDKKLNKTTKSSQICKLFGITKKSDPSAAAAIALICGQKVKLANLFNGEEFENEQIDKITFDSGFDDKEAEYQSALGEKFELIEKLKALYDWAVLADILKGKSFLCEAKVDTYQEHENDLKQLKKFVKANCADKYNLIFRESKEGLNNYTAYCKKIKTNGKNGVLKKTTNREDFCKFLKAELKGCNTEGYEQMFEKIENETFMPKQVTKDNSVIPMQVNRSELKAIIENASKYLKFLNDCDNDGISVAQKIMQIFEYRIPYYVGPLNTHSNKSWLIRGEEKIYPWNFEKVVDIDSSAEKFIENLTSKCTYLPDKDVIPKNSILYSKYSVLNELNNLRLDGEKISVELKQSIFNNLFMNPAHCRKVTKKALKNYLKSVLGADMDITGIDGDFKSTMKSAVELLPYNLTQEETEEVIKAITIFADDKKLLKKRLKNKYSQKLSEKEIIEISKLKYSGWGAFSKEFLTEIYDFDEKSGEVHENIINTLWNTNDNLMILLGSKYNFAASLEKALAGKLQSQSLKEMVENLYISPAVKRPVYRSIKIVNEIIKIMGNEPKKIFVEMTRRDDVKGDKGRKASRKDRLIELYKNCGQESSELFEQLCKTDNEEFKRDSLYLYYTQLGKCMYSGETIDISHLYDRNLYDIDHIFPRSKVKDDSLDNRVLVKNEENKKKANDYPIKSGAQSKMYFHWKTLLEKGLISKKKYDRLTRVTPLTDDELSDFIARQLVETSQSTKAVATLLGNLYPRPKTEIVYVKAALVSEFRHEYDMLKCREVNDFHHAKDAYLNIVVGNVYNVKYTHNKAIFIKGLQSAKYSLNKMYNYNTENVWIADKGESIRKVKSVMLKNNILYTRYSSVKSGGLFKLNPLKKGSGQVPLKQNSPLSDIQKYGGYDKPSASYFAFVKFYDKKGKENRQLVAIDSYLLKLYETDPEEYLKKYKGIENPQILIKCVKINSCLELNGFRMHISGKLNRGKSIIYKPGMQLVVGYKWEKYIRNITKVLAKPEGSKIYKSDEITEEENIELFNLLIYKMQNTILSVKFKDTSAKISKKEEKFKSLSLKEQCYVLNEMLKVIHCNSVIGDFKLLGEGGSVGTLTTTSTLSGLKDVKSLYLVNQSITGLFEIKIDLLNM